MKIFKMVFAGIVLIILEMLAEFLVTLPLGTPASEELAVIRQYLVWEFLLAALPAGALTFLAALVLRLKTRKDALLHGIVWTGLFLLYMLAVAIGNQRFGPVFGNISFYVLLALYFLGPLVMAQVRKLPA